MTSPQPDQQPTGLSGTEQAVVDTLTTALIEGSLVAGTAIPLYLLLRLMGAGSNRQAARAAIRLGLSEPVGRKAGPKVAGTAIGQVRAAEPQLRALYILNAAKRITDAMGHGATLFTAVRAERRFFDQHRQAARNRRRAARAVDEAAADSPFLYWQTANDSRVEADCRHLAGTLFTVADPPKLDGRVVWPGTVHPRCRCKALPFGASPLHALPTVTATR